MAGPPDMVRTGPSRCAPDGRAPLHRRGKSPPKRVHRAGPAQGRGSVPFSAPTSSGWNSCPCSFCRPWWGPIIWPITWEEAGVEERRGRIMTIPVPFEQAMMLAGILFCLGLAGVLVRRDAIFVLLSLEVMLNAAGLAFVVGRRPMASGGRPGDVSLYPRRGCRGSLHWPCPRSLALPLAQDGRHRPGQFHERLTCSNLLWLIPALPFAGFLHHRALGRRASSTTAAIIGVGSVGLSMALLAPDGNGLRRRVLPASGIPRHSGHGSQSMDSARLSASASTVFLW